MRSENAVEELHRRKDVVVIEFEHDRVPSKTEKIELEKSKRAISGFDINREWLHDLAFSQPFFGKVQSLDKILYFQKICSSSPWFTREIICQLGVNCLWIFSEIQIHQHYLG